MSPSHDTTDSLAKLIAASDKGRILLVSHNFPPTQGPESSLVKLNTQDLLRRGWNLSVLTTTMEHMHQGMDKEMMNGLPADLEIIRTPSYDAILRRRWPWFARIILTVLRRWILPEVFLLWLFSSVPAGKQWLKKYGPTIIYSRATKHVSNVTAWYLKRATGLPWVAHFSDPWVDPPFPRLIIWIGRYFEKRIFRDADAIVVVNSKLAEYFLRMYPHARDKTHVIPHAYAPLDAPLSPTEKAESRPLVAIHAGSFIPTLREPDIFFEAISQLNKKTKLEGVFQLICVGEDTTRYQPLVDKLELGGIIRLLGSVSYAESRKMIAASDLLVVLDTPNEGGVYLPTKLVEYLAFSKPILGLTEPGSAVHEVLEYCGLFFGNQGSPEKIVDALETILTQWHGGTLVLSDFSRLKALDYRIDKVNDQLDSLFENLKSTYSGFSQR